MPDLDLACSCLRNGIAVYGLACSHPAYKRRAVDALTLFCYLF